MHWRASRQCHPATIVLLGALSWLFELRGIADYGELRHVPEPEARKAIEAADAFVKACGALLHKRGLRPPT